MTDVNKHGLSRDIPAEIRRLVRQASGFGCVVCGIAIYQYEHVDPPFADAHAHDASAITLLCAGCHDRVTRGLLSKASVRAAMAEPKALAKGFSFGPFDLGTGHPTVIAGGLTAIRTQSILRVYGDSILTVAAPEQSHGPFRISALLRDASGEVVMEIVENEWRTPTTNWDTQVVGQTITIRRAPGDIALVLRAEPPEAIRIERLRMLHRGTTIICDDKEGFQVQTPAGQYFRAYPATAVGCEAAVDITPHGLAVGYRCESMHIGYGVVGNSPRRK